MKISPIISFGGRGCCTDLSTAEEVWSLGRSAALNRHRPARDELSDLQSKVRPAVCVLRTVPRDEGPHWRIGESSGLDKVIDPKGRIDQQFLCSSEML